MRPSVSYGYNPSFEKYYDTYALDAAELRQSNIPLGIYGIPGLNNSKRWGLTCVILLKLK
jgi:hypothetical protein